MLAARLRAEGHAVRGTTRDPARAEAIDAAGAEAYVGDPDRVATLGPALAHVTVACLLLGSASGRSDQLAALHGPRLEMLLTRMLDTTVRGIVYESVGSVDDAVLQGGTRRVVKTCEGSRIPYTLLRADPSDHDVWLSAAFGAVCGLLGR